VGSFCSVPSKRQGEEKYDADGHNNKAISAQPIRYKWTCPTLSLVWSSLTHLFDIQDLCPEDQRSSILPASVPALWSAGNCYCSLTPTALIASWSTLFRVPFSVAQVITHKFTQFLEEAATNNIWIPRCDRTVEWEKSHGIRAKAKHTEFSGDGSSFCNGGFIVYEGYCQCGSALPAHVGAVCPGAQNDPLVADGLLLESLLG
jgi:hypothetical protein